MCQYSVDTLPSYCACVLFLGLSVNCSTCCINSACCNSALQRRFLLTTGGCFSLRKLPLSLKGIGTPI